MARRGVGGWSPVARFSVALALVLVVTAAALGGLTAFLIGRYVEDETVTFTQEAVAGHFGTIFDNTVFEGNLTACGQVFHTAVVQVAHKSLPCGTLLRVMDTDTGNSVEAVVTDRGPYVAGRIVDLSWGAFRQLDPTGPGLIHVEIFLLEVRNHRIAHGID